MEMSLVTGCLFVFFARVADVTLATLRTTAVVREQRLASFVYSFVGMLIWIYVVGDVMKNLNSPAYMFAYALGFAFGTYLGMVVESWLAWGRGVIRIFSRKGREVALALREAGFMTTVMQGEGRDGPIQLLFIETRRRDMGAVHKIAQVQDPDCYIVLNSAATHTASR